MNSAWERCVALYRRLPPSFTPLAVIVLAVLLANGMYVFGLAQDNPLTWTANISHYLCRISCGRPAIDPNVGFITQPFGHLAALDLVHLHWPWWNYFEGLGSPLAGEMQSAALFPLTILFAMPSGLLWFHVSLQVIAGVSTYFLARRLSIPVVFATGAGVLFALDGTFAWLGNSVLNPVAFLPMLILGIELILDGAREGRRWAWFVAALAIALSIYAGFPEVAYLDGLFAGGWAIVRLFSLPRERRLVAVGRMGLAGVVGVAMALPILTPFYDFLKVAYVGGHTAAIDGAAHITWPAVPLLFDPYIYGTLFSNHHALGLWGGSGGYFGAGITALAIVGLFGRRLRALRIYLFAWVVVSIMTAFDALYLRKVWNLVPLVKTMAFSRYMTPSLELAMIVLAVFGLSDLVAEAKAKRLLSVATVVTLAIVVWCVFEASATNAGVVLSTKQRVAFFGLRLIPFLALGAILVISLLPRSRVMTLLLTLVLCGESLLLFFVPTAQAPKQITVDTAPITFLQRHEGEYRFMDFLVLVPNWGTQYGLHELTAIDLPFPKRFSNFIKEQLDPSHKQLNQFTVRTGLEYTGLQKSIVNHFAAYQATSLKYLLLPNTIPLVKGLAKDGVTLVFHDYIANIYEMPDPTPYFSAPGCTVSSSSLASATLHCSAATTLVRSELWMAGWHASVNGASTPITTVDKTFQGVAVPQGTSTVTFDFRPPHEDLGLAVGVVATLGWLAAWLAERLGIGRRRARH